MKVFISHSSRDKETADFVRNKLNSSGIDALVMHEQVSVGENIVSNIEEAIREADAFIMLISKAYAHSKWSDLELMLMYGQTANKNKGKRIYPVLLDRSARIPSLLQDVAYADFTDRHQREKAVERLLTAIKNPDPDENSFEHQRLRHRIKNREELLKIQELEYKLNNDRQGRLRKLFRASFILITITSLVVTFIFLGKGFDLAEFSGSRITFQGIIFYLLGFLTAIIPSLYFTIKRKGNLKNGK